MELKNTENNAIGNPKYSKETNDKVHAIISRAVKQSLCYNTQGEMALLITQARTYTAENIEEIYKLVETGSPEYLIEAIIILALTIE